MGRSGLLLTWVLEQKATANSQVTASMRRRLAAGGAVAGMAHAIITQQRLIRCAWTLYRWDTRPPRRP